MTVAEKEMEKRVRRLEQHLRSENPILVDVVKSFRNLDRIACRLGLMEKDESYINQIPWWPLISVLGTFSAGKSTFINRHLDLDLQDTGNQAVDDKFTVICYSADKDVRVLPGVALNSDPRFPFFHISAELDKVEQGEGKRIDSYLQLKTCPADVLRGSIIIDSPGFDADSQRTSTLRITDYIIDLSDLVLVFFDARHPEAGAMQDTLRHLVGSTISRRDSSKFIFVLNQIDATANEDNLEDVIAAWQRSLAQQGLTAGRFYSIYDSESAITINDAAVRERFERRNEDNKSEIRQRMERVRVERAYRIIDTLERSARELEKNTLPQLQSAISQWVRGVFLRDAGLFVFIFGGIGVATAWASVSQGMNVMAPLQDFLAADLQTRFIAILIMFVAALFLHTVSRSWSARSVISGLRQKAGSEGEANALVAAFSRNTRLWHSVFRPLPVGWGRGARKQLHEIIASAGGYVQKLNDRFANPSGESRADSNSNDKPV